VCVRMYVDTRISDIAVRTGLELGEILYIRGG
jgi:hypothetical protein